MWFEEDGEFQGRQKLGLLLFFYIDKIEFLLSGTDPTSLFLYFDVNALYSVHAKGPATLPTVSFIGGIC